MPFFADETGAVVFAKPLTAKLTVNVDGADIEFNVGDYLLVLATPGNAYQVDLALAAEFTQMFKPTDVHDLTVGAVIIPIERSRLVLLGEAPPP